MLRAVLFAAALAACRSPAGTSLQAALQSSADDGVPVDGPDAAVDAPPDAPPGEPGYEEHPAGAFVSWWNHVHQPMPYSAEAGDHVLRIRLTGNNGDNPPGPDADGVEASFDGGVTWCGPAGRPVLSPVGSVLECTVPVTAIGTDDSLDVRLRLWNGYEGWDVQHEYHSVDGGPFVEVTSP